MQDDIMSDEAAALYISDLQARNLPEPSDEQSFLKQNSSNTDAFLYTYGYYAATIAQAWYERNSQTDVTLGKCIRAADTGLILALYRFIAAKPGTLLQRFKDYAAPFIRAELDWLRYKAR